MEFSPTDPYLVTVLGFSYGPEVKKFIPKLSGAISRYYYDGDEYNSKFTYFSTYYADGKDAQEAFNHMKQRTSGIEFQEVSLKGKQVIWFAGRNITSECFRSLKKNELERL